jgi:hypothetical protein
MKSKKPRPVPVLDQDFEVTPVTMMGVVREAVRDSRTTEVPTVEFEKFVTLPVGYR